MKEALKFFIECVLCKNDKEERLNRLDNIRKILYSESETGYISTNLFDLIDEISVLIIKKTNNEVGDPFSIFQGNENNKQ